MIKVGDEVEIVRTNIDTETRRHYTGRVGTVSRILN